MRRSLVAIIISIITAQVFGQVTIDFTADKVEICLGESIKFTPTVSPAGTVVSSYTWNFGNGQGSNLQSPDYVYPAAGTYNVTLTVIINGQSKDLQKTAYIKVNPLPDAKFTILSTDCEAPFDITFQNNSSNSGSFSYSWNFGNGQSSNQQNPGPVTYNTDGTYNISLTVTNLTTGCKKVITDVLVVSPYEAGITAPLSACVGEVVQFEDNSTVGANSWTWNFDGLGVSSLQNPTFTFNTPGTYTISLTSQNTLSSCPSDQTTVDITINPKPVVSFVADVTAGCSPLDVVFDTSGSSGEPTLVYEWNYGDGQIGSDPSHTYASNGTYTVSLTITDGNGCSTTVSMPNYIIVEDPTVDFTADVKKGCGPLDVVFTANATSPNGSDPIVEYQWDFDGDGVIDLVTTTPTAPFTFPFGKYTVILTVVTANGCTSTITKNNYIKVGNEPSIDFVAAPLQACIKEPISFNSSDYSLYNGLPSSSYDPDEIEWEWTFGEFSNNGQLPYPGLEDPMWPFPLDTGYMDITLKVKFRGCEKEIIKTDYVYIKPPKSQFTVNELSSMVPQTVFCDPASFPVSVYVDAKGNHPDITNTPVPFTDPEDSWPTMSILGRANSTYTIFTDDIDVIWRWGDGTTTTFSTDGTGADISLNANFLDNSSYNHSYNTYGTYNIKQVIINHTTGCADSTVVPIYISKITADYIPSNDSVCFNSALSFDGFGIAPSPIETLYEPYTYSWTFNGSQTSGVTTTSTLENPTNILFNVAPGFYDIDMTITNTIAGGPGCSSSVSKQIRVLELPDVTFTPDDDAICAGESITFTPSANIGDPGPSNVIYESFSWNFGDGGTDNVNTPTHQYDIPNNTNSYNVTLSVQDKFGCIGTQTYPVEVTMPIPALSFDPVLCNNEIFVMSPSASQVAGPALDVTWVIDGATTISPSIPGKDTTYFFSETSTDLSVPHTIVLSVTDRNGCTAVSDPFDVLVSLPQANYTYTASSNSQGAGSSWTCPSVKVDFVDQSQSIGSLVEWNWTFGDGNFSTDQNPENLYVYAGSYDLSFIVRDEYGCTSDTITIPFLNISGPQAKLTVTAEPGQVCTQIFNFEMTDMVNVDTWTWVYGDGNTQEGDNPVTHIYGGQATYTGSLLIRDDKQCEVPIPFTVTTTSNGILADFSFIPSPTASLGQLVVFTDQSSTPAAGGIVNWEWLFSDGYTTSNTTGEDITHVFSSVDTSYITLLIKDAEGCYDDITKYIIIDKNLYIPNVFTPNGDGSNESWYIPGTPFKTYEVLVYNRWGTLMYKNSESTDGSTGGLHVSWDGRNNGKKLCSDGTYYYILKGTLLDDSLIESTGYITLVDGKE